MCLTTCFCVNETLKSLKAFSDKNHNHYKVLLEKIRQRFSKMVESDLSYHPLLPDNLYLCFWYATEKFGRLLSLANQGFVEQGIEIRKHPESQSKD
jgi:hypothetical protein|tara:strand:- start:329 stop:616 length:288 start_codon:yes stop_codon:yes gene_type:complete